MKTKKNYIKKNITKKNCNKQILEPFEKKYEKGLKPSITKAHNLRVSNLKKMFNEIKNIVQPKDDYYTYINSLWYKAITINKAQSYITEIDDFRLVQHKVYNDLEKIIKNYIQTTDSKEAFSLKKFYKSVLTRTSSEKCFAYAKKELEIIDNYRNDKDKSNPWKLLGHMNKNEMYAMRCPFQWKVDQDQKNVDKTQCYITSPTFSLPDVTIYFDDGQNEEYKKSVRNHFYEYIDNVFICCFGKNHGFNVKDVYDVEVQLINAFTCSTINESVDNYNIVTREQSIKQYSFDWDELSKNIGFSKTPSFFITSSLNYLKCGTKILLENWYSDKWRTYWIFTYIRMMTRFTKKGKDIYSNFYAKFIIGEKNIVNQDIVAVILTSYAFNNMITKEYVKKYTIPENIEYVKTLCNELKIVFTRIIKRNTWLQPKTKEYALLKLKHFKFFIGETSELLPDPILDYVSDDLWKNLVLLSEYRNKLFIKTYNNKPINIPILTWTTSPLKYSNLQAYIVNASYTPSKNAITIPLAYMQKPFLDLSGKHSFQYSLAYIGFTIGHEMSHSLDDWGSKYDYNGNLKDWWTVKDKHNYKIIQNDIIKQYEEWAKRDGIKYDASQTIGEDLADISGITTVIEYLYDFQYQYNKFTPIIENSTKLFFTFFAYQMRQKITKHGEDYQLKFNVHPPNKYRVNVPLSRTPIFRNIYNIKKGDKMYWHSTNRVWQS